MVCGKCSNQKYPLPFEDNRLSRVCRPCHQKLLQQRSASPDRNDSDAENMTTSFSRGKGLLEVRWGRVHLQRGATSLIAVFSTPRYAIVMPPSVEMLWVWVTWPKEKKYEMYENLFIWEYLALLVALWTVHIFNVNKSRDLFLMDVQQVATS